jgi:endoglucanase
MAINLDLLRRLCQAPGVPSREDAVARIVVEELGSLVDEVRSDALGNVIAVKRGQGGPRVMLAGHMDEIGFLVRHIEKEGFLRLQPLGGFDGRALFAQRVQVHTREGALPGVLNAEAKPAHLLKGEKPEAPKVESYFVDLGLPVEAVKERVRIGDMVTMERATEVVGDCVASKALDDRIGVFVMIEALRHLRAHTAEVIAVATVQEEVGLRGATPAGYALEPDVAIALDVTLAVNIPGTEERDAITRLGQGTAIKIMDGSLICDPRIVEAFRAIAEHEGIAHQMEILPFGGTDAGGIQGTRAGVPSFTLSVPTRYVHTVDEMAHQGDIEASYTLLARFLEQVQDFDL